LTENSRRGHPRNRLSRPAPCEQLDDRRRLGRNVARQNAFERARFLIGAAKMSYIMMKSARDRVAPIADNRSYDRLVLGRRSSRTAAAAGRLVDAAAVEAEWSGIPRAGMLAVPSQCVARLPHLTPHDVATIDAEVRETLAQCGSTGLKK
jgi:hypothetical protein